MKIVQALPEPVHEKNKLKKIIKVPMVPYGIFHPFDWLT
jgi:hypothetical protein